jgi:diacylglycerol O-acyltransferase / wax synthase
MQQLSGLDSAFLYMETPNQPMHIGSLLICDPSTAPGGAVRFKDIIEHFTRAAQRIPYMRRRLVEVPFNADFPYWINDANFDPEFHIRHIALPKPGDWRQLCIQVARLHSRGLDRNHPLWEIHVIEGLDNVEGVPPGSFAYLSKVHHACVDGVASTQAYIATSRSSAGKDSEGAESGWQPDKVPKPEELLFLAMQHAIIAPYRYAEYFSRRMPLMSDLNAMLRAGQAGASTTPVPRVRFNGPVSPGRVYDGVTFKFEQIRAMKAAIGGTVNDLMLAVCSGALRRYLLEKDELPEQSLVTFCPVNTRDPTLPADQGNVVSAMLVALRTDIADAKARAHAICDETRGAKELVHAVGAKAMVEAAEFISPGLAILGARLAAENGWANYQKPTFNCVTTNVPGSQEPLYCAGAEIVHDFGTGPVIDSNGLFHAIKSYHGEMTIGVTACREMMPDPAVYSECLRASYAELHKALLGKGRKTGKSPKRHVEGARASGGNSRSSSKAVKSAPTQSRTKSRGARTMRKIK